MVLLREVGLWRFVAQQAMLLSMVAEQWLARRDRKAGVAVVAEPLSIFHAGPPPARFPWWRLLLGIVFILVTLVYVGMLIAYGL